MWDVGVQDKFHPLWHHCYWGTNGRVYVVDCDDRDRVKEAKEELNKTMNEDEMVDSVVHVFANTLTPSTATRLGKRLTFVRQNWHLWWYAGDSAVARSEVQAPVAVGAGRGRAARVRGRGRGKGKKARGPWCRCQQSDVSVGLVSLWRHWRVCQTIEVFDDCSCVSVAGSLLVIGAIIREVNETVFALNFLETGCVCEKVVYSILSADLASPALHRLQSVIFLTSDHQVLSSPARQLFGDCSRVVPSETIR